MAKEAPQECAGGVETWMDGSFGKQLVEFIFGRTGGRGGASYVVICMCVR